MEGYDEDKIFDAFRKVEAHMFSSGDAPPTFGFIPLLDDIYPERMSKKAFRSLQTFN